MGNTEKWRKALQGKSHYEAWRYIWGKNNLKPEQRKALFKFWEELHSEKQQQVFKKWSEPEAWIPDTGDTNFQERGDQDPSEPTKIEISTT